jgi:tRNA nucleotidyltransferase/poly(A) polymerase
MGRAVYDLDLAVQGDGLSMARRLADDLQGTYYALDKERGTGRAILTADDGRRLVVDVAEIRGPDLASDLADRDFTINALAADVRTPASVIDNHNGLADLAAGLIRPVSDDSIRKDPLRALRAVRLGAALGFGLSRETEVLIRRDGASLAHVSSERVRDELARLLARSHSVDALVQLDDLRLLTTVIPELEPLRGLTQPPPHQLPALAHSLATVAALEAIYASLRSHSQDPSSESDIPNLESPIPSAHYPISLTQLEILAPFSNRIQSHLNQVMSDQRPRIVTLKLAALLHDTGKASMCTVDDDGRIRFLGHERTSMELTGSVLKRLRLSNGEVRTAEAVVRHHMRPLLLAGQRSVSSRAVYRFFRDTQTAGVDVLLHALADHQATFSPKQEDEEWPRLLALTRRMLSHYYERQAADVAPPRLISGHDLVTQFSLQPGPRIGELLELVREAQVCGQVITREEALDLVRSQLASDG